MFFNKKNKNQQRCEVCGSKIIEHYSFCPYCGNNLVRKKDREDFGLLGKNDFTDYEDDVFSSQGFGVMDKLVSSMFNSMMKNLDKQFKDIGRMDRTEVKTFPNGVRIKISGPFDINPKRQQKPRAVVRHEVDDKQLQRMSALPRAKAKANVKRFGDRVVYELFTPGVTSPQDVFVSRLENGYEIKAIGDKKVYVNSVPINLPLKKYSILNNKLLVEFLVGE